MGDSKSSASYYPGSFSVKEKFEVLAPAKLGPEMVILVDQEKTKKLEEERKRREQMEEEAKMYAEM